MHIGYVRMCQAIELDYKIATSTFIQCRLDILEPLLKMGHKITVYSEIKDEHIGKLPVIYEPKTLDIKCDVLFIENGSTNMNYMNTVTKEPHIRRMMKVVDAFDGLVLWYHDDCSLPFPFHQLMNTKYPWGHKKNGYCGGPRGPLWTVDSGWATKEEMLGKGKRHKVLMHTQDFNKARGIYTGSRSRYDLLPDNFRFAYAPQGLSPTLRAHLAKSSGPRLYAKKVERGLVYAGHDATTRNRIKSFRRLLGRYSELGGRLSLYGAWKDSTLKGYPNLIYKGRKKYTWEIDNAVHKYLASIQIGPENARTLGWISYRPVETVLVGTVCLIDKCLNHCGDVVHLPEKFEVETAEQMICYMDQLRSSRNNYNGLWQEQYEHVRKVFDPMNAMGYLVRKIDRWM